MKHFKIIEADQLLETNNPKVIEAKLVDYIMCLRNDGLSYATMKHMLAPILTFYQINDVLLNRKKIVLSERLDNLYPNMLEINHWKGKLTDIWTRVEEIESRPEVRESLKVNMEYPEDAWQELVNIWQKREFRPEALEYFPDDLIPAAVSPCYSCPGAKADEFNVWVSDYKELLKLKGIDHEQDAKERYQVSKHENWFFHRSSWYHRGVNGYDGVGCNNGVCVPECKFYPSEGKLYQGEGFD